VRGPMVGSRSVAGARINIRVLPQKRPDQFVVLVPGCIDQPRIDTCGRRDGRYQQSRRQYPYYTVEPDDTHLPFTGSII
jgi:hypothetical protein